MNSLSLLGFLDSFLEMFSYSWLIRAFVVGGLVTLCCSLLGTSLVLKRYSMIGSGLSNVGFGALAVATAFNISPLYISIPVVTIAAFLLLRLNESAKIKGDSAIALISTSALAIGIMIVSLTTGMTVDVCNYMFGSILATTKSDLWISIILCVVILVLYVIFYNKIFAVTFDENFARATGTKSGIYNTMLAVLTAITIVIGMRLMGVLLISALIVFPPLTSMRTQKSFKGVVILSSIVAELCFVVGMFLAYSFGLPTGASIVCCQLTIFVVFVIINLIQKKSKKGNNSMPKHGSVAKMVKDYQNKVEK